MYRTTRYRARPWAAFVGAVLTWMVNGSAWADDPNCAWKDVKAAQAEATESGKAALAAQKAAANLATAAGSGSDLAQLAQQAVGAAGLWSIAATAWDDAAKQLKTMDAKELDPVCAAKTKTEGAKKTYDEAREKLDAGSPKQVVAAAKEAADDATAQLKKMNAENEEAEKAKKNAKHSSRELNAAEVLESRANEWKKAASAWKEAVDDGMPKDGASKKADESSANPADDKKAAAAEKTAIEKKAAYEEAKKALDREQDAAGKAQEPETSTENFYLHAGLVSLTPFEIKYQKHQAPEADADGKVTKEEKPAAFFLDKSGLAARAYAEARFRRREAWEDARLTPKEIQLERLRAARKKTAELLTSARKRADEARAVLPAETTSASKPESGDPEAARTVPAGCTSEVCAKARLAGIEEKRARAADDEAAQAVKELESNTEAAAALRDEGQWGAWCLRHDTDFSFSKGVLFTDATLERLPACLLQNFDARFGYTFDANSDATGATVVGSGDINTSVAWGIPLFNTTFPVTSINIDGSSARISTTINVETLYEAVTDRGVLDIHDRWVIGGSWALGMLLPPLKVPGLHDGETLRPRVYEFAIRAGWTEADVPNLCPQATGSTDDPYGENKDAYLKIGCPNDSITLDSGDAMGQIRRTVRTHDGLPAFRSANGASIDLDISLPFGQTGYAVMGSTLLLGSDLKPNPWSFRLGLTVPFEQLLGVFPNVFKQ